MNINCDRAQDQRALDAAVHRLQERVMSEPDLAGQFEAMDFRRMLAHQITLFALFFGPAVEQGVRTVAAPQVARS